MGRSRGRGYLLLFGFGVGAAGSLVGSSVGCVHCPAPLPTMVKAAEFAANVYPAPATAGYVWIQEDLVVVELSGPDGVALAVFSRQDLAVK